MTSSEFEKIVDVELQKVEIKEKARRTIKSFYKVYHDAAGEDWISKYKRLSRWSIFIQRNGDYCFKADLLVKYDGLTVYKIERYVQDALSLFKAGMFINNYKG